MKIDEVFNEAFDNAAYYKTFNGRIKKMYEKARTRTAQKGYKDIIPAEDFYRIAEKDRKYREMFDAWEKSGFDIRMTPTLDRKDATKGYVAGNLDFLTYTDNVVKGNQEYDKRPWEARQIKITLIRGKQKKNFSSMTAVADFLEKNPSTITRALQQGKELDGWQLKTQ